jgi:hypothetical protein
MAAQTGYSNLRYLIVPVIALFFTLFSVSHNESGKIDFANTPCMGTVIVFKGATGSHLSSNGTNPEDQSLFSLNQTAAISGNHQLFGLNSHSLILSNADINFLRIYEREVKYELVTLGNTSRAPPFMS